MYPLETIKQKWEFECAYKSDRVWHNPCFVLFFLEARPVAVSMEVRGHSHCITYKKQTTYLTQTLIGYTIPKKVGKAVVRNKIKRRFRTLARLYVSRIKVGFLVLLAKVGATKTPFKKIHSDFLFALKKMGILHKETKESIKKRA